MGSTLGEILTCRNLGTGTLLSNFLILVLPTSFSATFTFSSASSTDLRTTSMNCFKRKKKQCLKESEIDRRKIQKIKTKAKEELEIIFN